MTRSLHLILLGLIVLAPLSATGQIRRTISKNRHSLQVASSQSDSTTGMTVNPIGMRQSRETIAREIGIKPMARLDNRIASRVQSRQRNRVDENYIPKNSSPAFSFAISKDNIENPR